MIIARVSLTLAALVIASSNAPPNGDRPMRSDDPSLTRARGHLQYRGEPFNGIVVQAGEGTVETIRYRDGVRNGSADGWYANGQHWYHREYIDGRESGEHRGWRADGSLSFDYHYAHGVMTGEAREWFANGAPYRVAHYREGHEEGAQQMWWEDGSLRANYVMRSGRRFGLPGTKGCRGTDSAEVAT